MRTLLFAMLLALMPMQADSAFKAGFDLQQEAIECDSGNGDMYSCGKLQGFVIGVVDASGESGVLTECLPEGGLSQRQVRLVVEKYLDDNTSELHSTASSLVLSAVNEAWPCPE